MQRRKVQFLVFGIPWLPVFAIFCLFFLFSLLVFDRPSSRHPVLQRIHHGYDDYIAPLFSILYSPLHFFLDLSSNIKDHFNTIGENRKLRKEVAELRNWKNIAEVQKRQLQAYENLFNASSEILGARIAAHAITETSGPFIRSLLVGAGEKQGVKKDFAVMNSHGLLGRVMTVGKRSSRVLLLTDLNSRIPVMTTMGQIRAIMAGDNSHYPQLHYIDESAKLEEGSQIMTSGDDGILPRGLLIGVIFKKKHKTEEKWHVRLFSDKRQDNTVWIYPYAMPVQPEIENQE